MGRHAIPAIPAIPAVVVAIDTALLAAAHGPGAIWVAVLYAAAALLAYRLPLAGFAAALLLAAVPGVAYALLIWCSYRAGRGAPSRRGLAVLVALAAGGLVAQLTLRPVDPRLLPMLVVTSLVFVALPVLVGRYLTQQERLVAALGERARLAERLRIARDMHDSVGHRLSLISIEAAALEVRDLPAPERDAVRRLATAAREAMTEVYEVVGALRDPQGLLAIGELVRRSRAAGVPVTLGGEGRLPELTEAPALPATVGQAAYRVVEEGLTNAAKHAPGEPVTVSVDGLPGVLRVTVTNPALSRPAAVAGSRSGLAGLAERVRLAGGLLEHEQSQGEFRLVATLPLAHAGSPEPMPAGAGRFPTTRTTVTALGVTVAAVIFVMLPASLMMGFG